MRGFFVWGNGTVKRPLLIYILLIFCLLLVFVYAPVKPYIYLSRWEGSMGYTTMPKDFVVCMQET